jgi:hypothetical protein
MGLNISFNEKKFSQIAIIFLIFISSCGGGGSQLPSIEDGSIQATLTTTLFKPDAIMLADASAYYSSACNKPSFQFLIPTKINEDIYADFIAHFWCDTDTPAEYNEGTNARYLSGIC